MVDGRATSQAEIGFRRRWYQAHVGRLEWDLDRGRVEDWLPAFRASAPEALAIRDRLASSGDVARFRAEQQAWATGPDAIGFRGFTGAMFFNSLVKYTDDHASLARLLADGLTPPRDRGSAAQKMDALAGHIERVRVGAHPMASSVAFALPYFWALERPDRWPVFWRTSREFLESSTGASFSGSPTERYFGFVDLVEELDEDYARFTMVSWWAKDPDRSPRPAFLDPVLVDRCAYGRDPEAIPGESLLGNAAVLVGIARHLRDVLAGDASDVVDRLVKPAVPRLEWKKGRPRSDFWVDWRVQGLELGLRLWVNDRGAAIGVFPGLHTRGWTEEARGVVALNTVDGFRMMGTQGSIEGDDVGFMGRTGSFIYGRWYETDQLAGLDLRAEVTDVARAAAPLLDALISRALGTPSSGQGTDDDTAGLPGDGDSPTVDDEKHDRIEVAANDLLVDRSFLDDVVELLEDKGQVILYGPPGTGKTYLAQRLAKALAPKREDRSLVQFHPSTSYEDFFEGYRPHEGPDGQILYRLTPGPLARVAKRAMEHPQRRQVMVIDEINRANLPKVLGELLYLFEYRNEPIPTLYRPDKAFELPETVWFIGTMNTADRSIGLVDAALRRRFHFVPFFPNRGPTKGLLDRWLKREGEPVWVGELVAMVNDELTEARGAELQLGASHFMKDGYHDVPAADDPVLGRIWRFSIEPFIEDQLFGNQDQIERFRLGPVVARYRSRLGLDDEPDGPT